MMKLGIYPGTFDPFTNGHLDLVNRGLKIFDEIVIAVADNPQKGGVFSLEERVDMARKSVANLPAVRVESFSGLLVDYVKRSGGDVVIRGLRAVSDFEYEMQMALMNRKMDKDVETVFMMPSLRYIFLSSTIVKEAARHGGTVEGLVPDHVAVALRKKFGR